VALEFPKKQEDQSDPGLHFSVVGQVDVAAKHVQVSVELETFSKDRTMLLVIAD
jgi:hypothetical protein